MRILVYYIYNNRSDSPIEEGTEIMHFDEYSYKEIEEDLSKEKELTDLINKTLKEKHGYFAVKVKRFLEL